MQNEVGLDFDRDFVGSEDQFGECCHLHTHPVYEHTLDSFDNLVSSMCLLSKGQAGDSGMSSQSTEQ